MNLTIWMHFWATIVPFLSRSCPENVHLWIGLTKQDTGVLRFTDGSPFDSLPQIFKNYDAINRHCYRINKDNLYQVPCENIFNFVCFLPGLQNWVPMWIFSQAQFFRKFLSIYCLFFSFFSDLTCSPGTFWYKGSCKGNAFQWNWYQ